jgi:hypothetical protein
MEEKILKGHREVSYRYREFSWAEPIPLSERILIDRRTATSIENSYGWKIGES